MHQEVSLGLFWLVGLAGTFHPGSGVTNSLVVVDDLYQLSDEQERVLAHNFTTHTFTPNMPIPSNVPTTFAFDTRSPLRELYPADKQINDGLYPDTFDFYNYPKGDLLQDLYEKEFTGRPLWEPEQKAEDKDPHLVDRDHLIRMLEHPFTLPRNGEANSSTTESIGQYIVRKFGGLGLLSGTQVFVPSQLHNMYWQNGEEVGKASNIIGIYPGQHFLTHQDKIILVGAHWDTVAGSDGYNDNGSGVAAMLEVARALIQSACTPRYTVLFVAFDKEEYGSQGSHEFVRGYLVPKLFKEGDWPEFQGALIMDSILNFNSSLNSQVLPPSWSEKVPETCQQIKEEGMVGNFLTMFYRSKAEGGLAGLMSRHWADLYLDPLYLDTVTGTPDRFKLKGFGINLPNNAGPNDLDLLADNIHFLRSDHARFWYGIEQDYQISLRALLLTDTGPFRGRMRRCYHRECDSRRNQYKEEFTDYDFIAHTVQAVIDTVTDLSGAHCSASPRSHQLRRYAEKDLLSTWEVWDGEGSRLAESSMDDDMPEHHPLGNAHNAIDKRIDEGDDEDARHASDTEDKSHLSSGAGVPSGLGGLANPTLYLAYCFKWLPSLFVNG